MKDEALFIETADDVARVYGDRLYLMEGMPTDQDGSAKEEPRTLLSGIAKPEAKEDSGSPSQMENANEESAEKAEKPVRQASYDKPGIEWRPKESSKVLFILHQAELKNKVLTELLKQIVLSINIPFESAGFGIIKGPVSEIEFQHIPNPYGIVFDPELLPGDINPMPGAEGSIFFTERLKDLQHDKNAKRALWEHLKSLKTLI